MTVYKAQEMYELAYSKHPFEQEKEEIMNKIHDAATRGDFLIRIFKDELTDHRLILTWLTDLGYRCVCYAGYENEIYVKWEK